MQGKHHTPIEITVWCRCLATAFFKRRNCTNCAALPRICAVPFL